MSMKSIAALFSRYISTLVSLFFFRHRVLNLGMVATHLGLCTTISMQNSVWKAFREIYFDGRVLMGSHCHRRTKTFQANESNLLHDKRDPLAVQNWGYVLMSNYIQVVCRYIQCQNVERIQKRSNLFYASWHPPKGVRCPPQVLGRSKQSMQY
jgi:hypothetical protein